MNNTGSQVPVFKPVPDRDNITRRLVAGAEVMSEKGVHFRVWAPRCRRVEVALSGNNGRNTADFNRFFELSSEQNGYFSGPVTGAREGTRYYYRLDGTGSLYPDPASRFQPEGPEGPSEVIDPGKFRWTDGEWKGVSLEGQVIYEMHIGTFTSRGDWQSAAEQVESLSETGITVIEVMPVAEFPGSFGWGYDGVDFFAPTRLYGRPDDFRLFVDKAHSAGIGVILDVVYNHFGPVGAHLKNFSPYYVTDRYKNEWGEAINFDGPESGPVREFFTANAGYWIDEFHLDGLRLDATQQIFDESPEHILTEIARRARKAAGERKIILIAENEPQNVKLVRPAGQGGFGLDGLWNDDFHHSALVALTGRQEGYYTDYLGNPQEFISSLKWGYLYQGQWYKWQRRRRGTPCFGIKPSTFIIYLQNHDQVANSARGLRIHQLTSPGLYRAMTALLLLAPATPLIFQGQEFAASSPFLYFSNIDPGAADNIHRSRLKFLSQFRSLRQPEVQARIPRPDDPATFERSKLDLSEREKHAGAYALHRDLLRLRREDPVLSSQRTGGLDGAVIGLQALALRFFGDQDDDRLLITNLGRDLFLDPAPEPLLAPPEGTSWKLVWWSEHPDYGGSGTGPLETGGNWNIPGQTTLIMRPEKIDSDRKAIPDWTI